MAEPKDTSSFFRKVVKDQGQALGHLAGEISKFVDSGAGNGRLKVERELLATALEDANAIVGSIFGIAMYSAYPIVLLALLGRRSAVNDFRA